MITPADRMLTRYHDIQCHLTSAGASSCAETITTATLRIPITARCAATRSVQVAHGTRDLADSGIPSDVSAVVILSEYREAARGRAGHL